MADDALRRFMVERGFVVPRDFALDAEALLRALDFAVEVFAVDRVPAERFAVELLVAVLAFGRDVPLARFAVLLGERLLAAVVLRFGVALRVAVLLLRALADLAPLVFAAVVFFRVDEAADFAGAFALFEEVVRFEAADFFVALAEAVFFGAAFFAAVDVFDAADLDDLAEDDLAVVDLADLPAAFLLFSFASAFFSRSTSEQSQSALLEERLRLAVWLLFEV